MERQIVHEQIELVTKNLWEMFLKLDIALVQEKEKVPTGEKCVRSSVELDGAWKGVVIIQTSHNLAERIRNRMFDGYDGELGVLHLEDAMREIANITGGNLKNAVPDPTQLSIPKVEDGVPWDQELAGRCVLDLSFQSSGEPYQIRVLARE